MDKINAALFLDIFKLGVVLVSYNAKTMPLHVCIPKLYAGNEHTK
jgi:hypothetical protein